MNKTKIYVPIANKKEAKRAKAVLEAMGEVLKSVYWLEDKPSSDQTQLVFHKDGWMVAKHWEERTKTTLKQLIELLVVELREKEFLENANHLMEQMSQHKCMKIKTWIIPEDKKDPIAEIESCGCLNPSCSNFKSAEPEKIAVRVDNEKEFNALMKYYDSLGWKWNGGMPATSYTSLHFPNDIMYEDSFMHSLTKETLSDRKIIPFSEFAKEHGIRVPLLVSEDNVELFEGDKMQLIYKLAQGYEWSLEEELKPVSIYKTVNKLLGEHKAFSTKQAALDWIEAQKPKEILLPLTSFINAHIQKDKVLFKLEGREIKADVFNYEQIKSIYKAMEELNNG